MPGILGFITALTQMVSPRPQNPHGEGGDYYVNPLFEESLPEEVDESTGFDITTTYYRDPNYGRQRIALLKNLGCITRKRLSSEETLDAFAEMIDWMTTNLQNHYQDRGLSQKIHEVSTWTDDNIMETHQSIFGFINDDHAHDDDDDDDVFE